jgi:hypothetical protein
MPPVTADAADSSSAEQRQLQEALDTQLFFAAMTGDLASARAALAAGAAPSHANVHGVSPLLVVAGGAASNAPLMRALLEAGADVAARDRTGWTALVLVASSGQMPLLELLLAAGADANYAGAAEGSAPASLGFWTPLTRAAFRGQAAAARRLLEAGADARLTGPSGRTAREIAAEAGHAEVVQVLDEWERRAPPLPLAAAAAAAAAGAATAAAAAEAYSGGGVGAGAIAAAPPAEPADADATAESSDSGAHEEATADADPAAE